MSQLLVLDLSKNQLQRFDAYSSLPSQLRNLKFLDLSDNDLRSVVELEHLQGMTSVTSISLKGNPCEEQARDFVSYSSSVRKYFPNLESLVRSGRVCLAWGEFQSFVSLRPLFLTQPTQLVRTRSASA